MHFFSFMVQKDTKYRKNYFYLFIYFFLFKLYQVSCETYTAITFINLVL